MDTRRALLGGAAAGSLLLLAGGARGARAQLGRDREIVATLLDLEQRALALYEGATEAGGLDVTDETILRRFAEQQREHVEALAPATEAQPSEPTAQDGAAGGGALLDRALEVEQELVDAYFQAHQRLSDSALVTLGAGIMATHGQRLVALRDLRGEDVLVPEAFPTGT